MPTNISNTNTDPDDEQSADRFYILALVVVAVLGGVFAVLFVPPRDFGALGTITGVALASLMAGGLLGFLFGIPRRLQDGAAPPPANGSDADERSLYAGNTNLEQISDWLTKIIVGVSLVQLMPIITFVQTVGKDVATSMGMADKSAFPTAAIILYVTCGFMIGYLWARLYLPRALNESERTRRKLQKLDELTKRNEADVNAVALARAQLSDQAATRPTAADLKAAIAAASTETRAYIFYLAENLRWKNWRDKKPVMERTIPIFQALVASDTDSVYHRNFGQLAYALKDQRRPDYAEAEKLFSKAIEIRGAALDNDWHAYEANRAICRIHLDPHYTANPKSAADAQTQAAIMDDLTTAAQDGWVYEWLSKDGTVLDWLYVNVKQMPPPPSPT